MYDAIVIGGGVNGLIAAIAVARRKKSVLVLERRDAAGGAAMTSELLPGFHVPALTHTIGPIRADIARAIGLTRLVEMIAPDPAVTSLGANGRVISFHRDPVLTAASIDRVSPADAARWRPFLASTNAIGRVVAALQRQQPPPLDGLDLRDILKLLKLGRHARRLGRHDLARAARWTPMAVADLTAEWFGSDQVKAAIAAHAVFGNFAGPRSGGTGGMLLQRLGADPLPVGTGVSVRGGPGALTRALTAIAEKAGVTIRTGALVRHIRTTTGAASGVALDSSEEIISRAVVAAIDPRQALIDLVDPVELAPTIRDRARHLRQRGVTAKVNLALAGLPPVPAVGGDAVPLHGRLLIAPGLDYLERAFDAAKYGAWSPAPWLDISIPSVADPTLVPEGRHVMSICVHYAPRHLRAGSWAGEKDALYRSVLSALEPHMPGLPGLVLGSQVITPEDMESGWGLTGGHIFHAETTLDQSWIARPLLGWARHRAPVPKLYLASAGTHPGGGLTGASGWLAAQAVIEDLK
jgi:phytoene dehydrogenase-like protein